MAAPLVASVLPDTLTPYLVTMIVGFVVAIYGLLVFSVGLRWLPAIGAGAAGDLGDQALHLVLPAFASPFHIRPLPGRVPRMHPS